MSTLVTVAFVLLFVYTAVLCWLSWGFFRSGFRLPTSLPASVPVSIIVCARNEEVHIGPCIRSIVSQQYPSDLVELIIVNDASTDRTLAIAESELQHAKCAYRIINNPVKKGKKQSITSALKLALHPLIVLRDADTYTKSSKWLKRICDMNQATGADLIIGPVEVVHRGGLLSALQVLEVAVLNLMSCGSARYGVPFLSSAANLSFTKNIYDRVGGYARHAHIDSGDDIFFLEDVKKVSNNGIVYLKSVDAIVYTYPEHGLRATLVQRIRWASKIRQNRNPMNFLIAFLVALVNLSFIGAIALLFSPQMNFAAAFIALKLFCDMVVLSVALSFTRERTLIWYGFPLTILYPLYMLPVTIGAFFLKPAWKE